MVLPIVEELNVSSFEELDPFQSSKGHTRIKRTLELLDNHIEIQGTKIADIGCGTAVIGSFLSQKGAYVTAVDIKERELDASLNFKKASLFHLPLRDATLDGLVFTDVIAELEPHLYRLALSELSRLLNPGGWMIVSTELDLYSLDAFERFQELIQTEFELTASTKSYHLLHFYLTRLIKAPQRFVRAAQMESYRLKQLEKRSGLMRLWFYINSTKWISSLWKPMAFLFKPVMRSVKTNQKLLLRAEKFSKLLFGSKALTHIIILARKKKI